MCIDYGEKRTGIAVTDPLQIIATALQTIETPQLFIFLKKYYKTNQTLQMACSKEIEFYDARNIVKYTGNTYSDTLTINELVQYCIKVGVFEQIIKKGFCYVSYNGKQPFAFVPHARNRNLHQAVALSSFINSIYFQIGVEVKISTPHDNGCNFEAIFKKVDANCVEYTNADGTTAKFTFDPFKASQFIA